MCKCSLCGVSTTSYTILATPKNPLGYKFCTDCDFLSWRFDIAEDEWL